MLIISYLRSLKSYDMFLKYLKEYAIMTLGLAVFVFGWTAFLNPHEITGGGIAGLASVIHYGIDSIPVSYAKFAITSCSSSPASLSSARDSVSRPSTAWP